MDHSKYEDEDRDIPRLENDEYFIHELVELERDFEDELFFECPEEELDQYYRKRADKVQWDNLIKYLSSY